VDNCPSGYFEANTKKCVVKCEGVTNKITPENGCTNICSDGQFLFEQSEKINDETITKLYCVSKCPDEARFYYTNFQNQEKKCLKECNKGHFYSIDNDNKFECLESCEGISNIDLSANIFQCNSSSTDTSTPQCDDSFPYEYQSSCLRNCSDTQNLEIFGNKTTYFLEYTVGGNKKKICSENCQEDKGKKYRNSNTLSCH
jgi:hypothetical protein